MSKAGETAKHCSALQSSSSALSAFSSSEKGNSPAKFIAWMDKIMDLVGENMRTSKDPEVMDAWKQRRLSPKVIEQVILEEGKRLRFKGVHTIEPDAGVLTDADFAKILADKMLVYDPVFSIDYSIGSHGKHIHALTWLYLADGDPGALQIYERLGTEINKGDRFWADWLCSPLTRWVLTPNEFTPLTETFLGNYSLTRS